MKEKKKKICEFSEKPYFYIFAGSWDPAPAQSPFENSELTDKAEYGWACISVTFFTSFPLSDTSKVMAPEHESHRMPFLEASMSGKQLWSHGMRVRRPRFKL